MIIESGLITATNADMMSGGRLNAIPYNGTLTMQFLSNLADASNNFSLTIQKPNGDVPIDGQLIPGSNPSLDGVIDDRQMLELSFQAGQGGHFVVSVTETGTAVLTYRFILRP